MNPTQPSSLKLRIAAASLALGVFLCGVFHLTGCQENLQSLTLSPSSPAAARGHYR